MLRIWDSWPLRNRETFEKYPPPHQNKKKKTFLPGGRQRNLKSRVTLSGKVYVTGRYSAGAHYFSGMDSLNVAVRVVACVEDTLQHKNNGQLRLVMYT